MAVVVQDHVRVLIPSYEQRWRTQWNKCVALQICPTTISTITQSLLHKVGVVGGVHVLPVCVILPDLCDILL